MTVDPKRHDDDDITAPQNSGEESSSAALPPTLFELPNLSADDCCQAASETAVESETTGCEKPACETPEDDEGSRCGEMNPQSEPLAEDPLPVVDEVPVEFSPVPDLPADSPPETSTRRKDSLMDIWGTRAVVFGLLMIAVTAAVIAAQKTRKHSERPTLSESDIAAAEELMLEDFAVSEGEEIPKTNASVDTDIPAPSEAEMMVAAVESPATEPSEAVGTSESVGTSAPAETSQPVAEGEIATSTTVPSGPTAVLSAPVAEPGADVPHSLPNEPAADRVAVNENNATVDATKVVAASAVSDRADSDAWMMASPKQNEFAATPSGPASAMASQTNVPAPEQQQTTAESVGDASPSPAVSTAQTAKKPSMSESVRYSSTPNGISDLIRFLPPVAEKTPTP